MHGAIRIFQCTVGNCLTWSANAIADVDFRTDLRVETAVQGWTLSLPSLPRRSWLSSRAEGCAPLPPGYRPRDVEDVSHTT